MLVKPKTSSLGSLGAVNQQVGTGIDFLDKFIAELNGDIEQAKMGIGVIAVATVLGTLGTIYLVVKGR
jgi:hypothetical protein